MSSLFELTPHADISFDAEGLPYSTLFEDVYFSKQSGIDETRHVFIDGNDLIARWQALPADQPGQFIIAETGFGSGLNFLVTWHLWQQYAPKTWQLHFISCEKYPLRKTDLERCCQLWPQFKELSRQLLQAYPVCTPGFHRLTFNTNVTVTLMLGDAYEMYSQCLATDAPGLSQAIQPFTVDAWFLDGFSPRNNPELWQQNLFRVFALLSDEQTTLATFTVSGLVKKGLTESGFSLKKRKGFGRKREMLIAKLATSPDLFGGPLLSTLRFPGQAGESSEYVRGESSESTREGSTSIKFRDSSPHATPWYVSRKSPAKAKKAIIVGAGLAGCHSANALARRGYEVRVIESQPAIASGASGNPQGLLFGKLSPSHSPLADFVLTSYLFASQFYQRLDLDPEVANLRGMLQLAITEKEINLQQSLNRLLDHYPELAEIVDVDKASQLSGIDLLQGGLYWPHSGWINPKLLCQKLLKHPLITVSTGQKVDVIEYDGQQWTVGEHRAPIVILANGPGVKSLVQVSHLPVKPIKGQVNQWRGSEQSHRLKIPLCADGYLGPVLDGWHCLGATYNLGRKKAMTEAENTIENLSKLQQFNLDFEPNDDTLTRVSSRVATPDYLPIVGAVPIPEFFNRQFSHLAKNANAFINSAGEYHPGLYVSVGYGSRGLTYTPLCAELLAATINQEPLPLPYAMIKHLSPARFIMRKIIKRL